MILKILKKIGSFLLVLVTLPFWLPILLWVCVVFTLLNFEIDPEQTNEEEEDEM